MLLLNDLTDKQIDHLLKHTSCLFSGLFLSHKYIIERMSYSVCVWIPTVSVKLKTGKNLDRVKIMTDPIFYDYGFVFGKTIDDNAKFLNVINEYLMCKMIGVCELDVSTINHINNLIPKLEHRYVTKFDIGESVTIKDGSFSGMSGKVMSIKDKKITVEIYVFNRGVNADFECEVLERID